MTLIRILQWKLWAYGLVSGFIGGGATVLTSSGLFASAHQAGFDVPLLNMKSLALMWISGGIWTAMSYLAKSPLPAIDQEALKRRTDLKVEAAKLSGDPKDVRAATVAITAEIAKTEKTEPIA